MTRAELQKQLAKLITNELADLGFRLNRSTNWLEADQTELKWILSFSWYGSLATQLYVSPVVGIRCEKMVKIFETVNNFNRADSKFKRTLSIDVWRLINDRKFEKFSINSSDADDVANKFPSVVLEIGLPFLQKFKTVSDIDQCLNSEPNSQFARLLSLDNWTRMGNAVISAKLAGNPNYWQLVELYRESLTSFSGGHYIPQFELLVEALNKLK